MKLLAVLFVLLAAPAWGQSINYPNIKVLNTPVVDVGKGFALTDDELINLKSGKSQSVVCPGSDINQLDNTVPWKLNGKRLVAGYCFQPGIGDVGFLYNPHTDRYLFIHPVGSQSTFLFGVSECGQAAGQIFKNGRYLGLLWDGTQAREIDFPVPNANTALLTVNCNQVALGAYFTYDPITNGASEWTPFLYSNGSFFPFDRPGFDWIFPVDSTEEGPNLIVSDAGGFQGGPSFAQGPFSIEDDGTFSSLSFPSTVAGFEAFNANFIPNGINEAGQLGGRLSLISCPNPAEPFNCTVHNKGFVATPAPVKAVKK